MDFSRLEKLKGLVKYSPILSAPEKAEWVALLELMNEKQLSELEKILGNDKQQIVGDQRQTAEGRISNSKFPILNTQQSSIKPENGSQKTAQEKLAPSTYNLTPKAAQLPKLSHIMNLPSNIGGKVGSFRDVVQNKKLEPKAAIPPKPQNPFATKLKSIFAEKELPAPKPEQLLASTATDKGSIELKPISFSLSKPVEKEDKPQTTPLAKPQPPIVPKPVQKVAAPQPSLESTPNQYSDDRKFSSMRKDLTAEVTAILENKNSAKSAPETSAVSAETEFKTRKPIVQEKPIVVEMAPVIAKKQTDPPFNQLKDLAVLDVPALDIYDFNALVKKIKSLTGKFGYHEALFNLEQSTLYKSYIKTGVEVLNGQQNFEQLTNQKTGNYLNRRQFEEMADLLRQIQAG